MIGQCKRLFRNVVADFKIFSGVFNKTIITLTLVGYKIVKANFLAQGTVGYLPSNIQRIIIK